MQQFKNFKSIQLWGTITIQRSTLFILPYSCMSNQIVQSLRFVLNQSLCRNSLELAGNTPDHYDKESLFLSTCKDNILLDSSNLILCLKCLQSHLIELLQKTEVLICRTRNKIHYAVYTFFTIISCNSRFDVCQHLPVGFHHLLIFT